MVSRKQQESGRKTTSVHTPEDSMTLSENEVCCHYVYDMNTEYLHEYYVVRRPLEDPWMTWKMELWCSAKPRLTIRNTLGKLLNVERIQNMDLCIIYTIM